MLPESLIRDRAYFEQQCRAAARAIPMSDGVLLARILGEPLAYLDGNDRTFTPWACFTGYWESWISIAMARTIKPGDAVLDLGAHQGYYTVLAALAAGPTGHVCAVEPNPSLAALVRSTMEVNGLQRQCDVIEAAVSNRADDVVTLVMPQYHGCNSTIVREPGRDDTVITVPTTTVDELVKEWDKLSCIKIDCEGAEELIWDGMQETIRRHSKVCLVMEVNTARAKDPEHFYQDIAKHFPLRAIDGEGVPRQVTIDDLMTRHPSEDWMLWLRRSGTP